MSDPELEMMVEHLDEQVQILLRENERLRAALNRLIDNVQSGSYESTGQCIDECRKLLNTTYSL
jgi:hypothetical protein